VPASVYYHAVEYQVFLIYTVNFMTFDLIDGSDLESF
jgi:hypothetical protein